ncbi:MAG: bifunctional demethylmenaquinone methyltransferase/2-methoxy-6-polyprenyl-1,4-benzoquinol methylase [Ignavibacteria bacterium GWB2_35_12]|nr:MAG: bifunctional demethylmenaquinone methyltransferase/2-methoxy-6-polyprenyl-1,4-benzoquinol methylase [Ignavibacteria bacterium GWA2_35_8]OGU40066.1 MAG: bifunctional demethylmenaquinone methyltransferase/2-methoxy-6-polyprenyl-1,4-benzoquinol methylase [Ignavibacteria bacterium GWB2_35_12]OGU94009.1 MAG: bifunctional demethylmenaquinone methyltransferase/2-methoxy-6-polyprenyl-1,4-benzoquinol methylase [Ignavibacteria bacterium RIFOXYA2_FULL_35_10]OGV22866.1 MAG: bifunctional demethylmena
MSEEIKNMFSVIARKYDLINDVLSFGIHRRWRKNTVRLAEVKEGMRILDIACGTGDLAFEFKKAVGKDGNVIGVDFSEGMLELARIKAEQKGINVEFINDDALNLPYENNRFDRASIAFGIRNVDDIITCLKEMARVVNQEGKVVVLEFGTPTGIFKFFYKLYSKFIIPLIGKLISYDISSYHYLVDTISKFPYGENFLELMSEANVFTESKSYKMTFGIVYLYIGIVK